MGWLNPLSNGVSCPRHRVADIEFKMAKFTIIFVSTKYKPPRKFGSWLAYLQQLSRASSWSLTRGCEYQASHSGFGSREDGRRQGWPTEVRLTNLRVGAADAGRKVMRYNNYILPYFYGSFVRLSERQFAAPVPGDKPHRRRPLQVSYFFRGTWSCWPWQVQFSASPQSVLDISSLASCPGGIMTISFTSDGVASDSVPALSLVAKNSEQRGLAIDDSTRGSYITVQHECRIWAGPQDQWLFVGKLGGRETWKACCNTLPAKDNQYLRHRREPGNPAYTEEHF